MSLASVTVVSRETFAKTRAVITFTTTRAITSFGISIATKSIVGRWAFNQGAIWASETIITFATITVFCIPCTIVFSSYIFIYIKWNVVLCEFLQALANTVALQSFGHALRLQPSPLKPGKHLPVIFRIYTLLDKEI